jgi:polyisoprenoid-binding protein YceI
MTFKSTKVEKTATGLTVTGDLTIKDVTKPVVLTVEGPAPEQKNPWGQTVSAVKATGKINRKDWGLAWNKTLEAGGLLVGEEVTLVIDAELTKAADPAPAAAPAKDAKAPAKKK